MSTNTVNFELVQYLTLNDMMGHNYPPLSEKWDFSATEHQIDLRPVYKLKFVHFSPGGEKTECILLALKQSS